ncbi:MAG: DUF262 domain-containing protein, partial [Firmicutes bacterium]|nr:DUF262 domain-containing protein [Bacillota bacterium]
MKVDERKITIAEVVEGYNNSAEEGVFAYGGKLNVRPPYQREYIYTEKDRDAVIDSILRGLPLSTIHWAKNDDGTLEVLDGQQRTISFCEYVNENFGVMVDGHYMQFSNLTKTDQDTILNHKLSIYICEGNDKEKLDWFRIINIAGIKLTEQELRNAVYTGAWLAHAKTMFSKSNGAAVLLGDNYVNGSAIRQEVLETALKWISKNNIESYMSAHQHDPN